MGGDTSMFPTCAGVVTLAIVEGSTATMTGDRVNDRGRRRGRRDLG